MSDIVEQLRIAVAIPICKPAADEIESLRQQLENMTERYNVRKELGDHLAQQLAAIQAVNQQLREILGNAKPLVQDWCNENGGAGVDVFATIHEALAQHTDTTALEAMIAKAGEVMRERCAKACTDRSAETDADAFDEWDQSNYSCAEAIRALPGVTLEDLK